MEIYILMGFIWFIGWIIAIGRFDFICNALGQKYYFHGAIPLFFTWPHYLGYTFHGKIRIEKNSLYGKFAKG